MTGDDCAFHTRFLDVEDWHEWRSIRLRALAQAPYAFGSTFEEWERAPEGRWRDRLSIPGAVNVVAYRGDTSVGMASAIPDDTPGFIKLISVWVAPGERGVGVLDLLVSEILKNVDSEAEWLTLEVLESNLPAIKAYERNGFERTSRESADPENPFGQEIVMIRSM